ncbi:MAG: multidrug effflux MFS transporter [Burkholderiales bacterium]|nr:multidrug effflux MFS transporter [Burkholderiales bacterium]
MPIPPAASALPAPARPSVILLAALAAVGAFSIDTFLPSMAAIARALDASAVEAQQVLAVYMLGFALMSLWHGSISDAVGRRPVILGSLVAYALASLVCTLAPSIEVLLAARFMQGLFGGAGSVVARAIVRDCYEGAAAQRAMSSLMMIFSIAPAVAPVIGGLLQQAFGWRSVFAFMLLLALVLITWAWRALPETLPQAQRAPLAIGALARGYAQVFSRREFQLLAGASALTFATFFLYVAASPAFILRHLGMTETDFVWFFAPVIGGMTAGAALSGRLAGRLSLRGTVQAGYAVMLLGMLANLSVTRFITPGMPAGAALTALSVAPLVVGAFGLALISPSIQLMLINLFPERRGMVASCQGFTQLMVSATAAGVVAPAVTQSSFTLALSAAAFLASGLALWLVGAAIARRRERQAGG